jgi:[acyl-carrier-protein] S-malonyltransferase
MSKNAIVFPGQGSQSIGMLAELAANFPTVTRTFSEVSECLGYDVWRLVQEGPESKLNQTEYTQVAMLTADVAVFRVLEQETSLQASMMAGHSLGEYAALVCAGALKLVDAASLVEKRGKHMQETVPLGQGAMAAIVGLTDEQVMDICMRSTNGGQQVTPANYNAIGQVVIAGHTSAVEKALALAEEEGARMALPIPVSVPCHCPLLVEAADRFAENLHQTPFQVPSVSVISNVDLSIYHTVAHIRSLLKEQLFKPVRWVETIQLIKLNNIDNIIECGPGKVLSGLVKRIDKTMNAISINDKNSLEKAVSTIKEFEGS